MAMPQESGGEKYIPDSSDPAILHDHIEEQSISSETEEAFRQVFGEDRYRVEKEKQGDGPFSPLTRNLHEERIEPGIIDVDDSVISSPFDAGHTINRQMQKDMEQLQQDSSADKIDGGEQPTQAEFVGVSEEGRVEEVVPPPVPDAVNDPTISSEWTTTGKNDDPSVSAYDRAMEEHRSQIDAPNWETTGSAHVAASSYESALSEQVKDVEAPNWETTGKAAPGIPGLEVSESTIGEYADAVAGRNGGAVPTLNEVVPMNGDVIPTLTEVVPESELLSIEKLRQAEAVLPPVDPEQLPPSSLEQELVQKGATQEEIAAARIIESEVSKLSPENADSIYRNLHKLEMKKNEAFAGIYGWVSQQFGNEGIESTKGAKGTMGRFLHGLSSIYKERNQDIERKIAQMEEAKAKDGGTTTLQKLSMAGYVTGGLMRYGRMVSDVVGWTAAAPARFYIFATTAAEGTAKAATEARLKNEEVINETRIEDPEKAADEAWALYEEAMKSAGVDESGEPKKISAQDLQKSYNDRMPKDILDRLQKAPKEGDGERLVSRLARSHVKWLADRTEKKLEAIDADTTLDAAGKERAKQRELEGWGKLKMFQEYDRMLSQNGAIDSLAATGVLAQYVAKGASLGLMAQGAKMFYDRIADVLASGVEVSAPSAPFVGSMSGELNATMDVTPQETPSTPGVSFAETPINGLDLPPASGDPDFYSDDRVSLEGVINPHTVAKGETLIGILSSKVPSLGGLPKSQQEAEILRVLRAMSPDQLRGLGVASGNADLIRPEESIDVAKFSSYFSSDALRSSVEASVAQTAVEQVELPTATIRGGAVEENRFDIPSESESITERSPRYTDVAYMETAKGTPLDLQRVKDPDVAKAVQIFYQKNGRAPTEEEASRTYLEFFGKKSGGVVNLYDRQAGVPRVTPDLPPQKPQVPQGAPRGSWEDPNGADRAASGGRSWEDPTGTQKPQNGRSWEDPSGGKDPAKGIDPRAVTTENPVKVEVVAKNPIFESLSNEYPRVGIPEDPLVLKHKDNPLIRQMLQTQESTLAAIEQQYQATMDAQQEAYRQGEAARKMQQAATEAAQREMMTQQGIAGIRGGQGAQTIRDGLLQYGLGKITGGAGTAQEAASQQAQYNGAMRSLREQFAENVRNANRDFARRILEVSRQLENQSKK